MILTANRHCNISNSLRLGISFEGSLSTLILILLNTFSFSSDLGEPEAIKSTKLFKAGRIDLMVELLFYIDLVVEFNQGLELRERGWYGWFGKAEEGEGAGSAGL